MTYIVNIVDLCLNLVNQAMTNKTVFLMCYKAVWLSLSHLNTSTLTIITMR